MSKENDTNAFWNKIISGDEGYKQTEYAPAIELIKLFILTEILEENELSAERQREIIWLEWMVREGYKLPREEVLERTKQMNVEIWDFD